MISSLDPNSQLLLANLRKIGETISRDNQQISSGSRISVASDAPEAVADILDLKSAMARNTQIQSNLNVANSDVNAADSVLQSAIKLMDRARAIGTSGSSTSSYTTEMAGEITSILESMVGLSNTQVGGRYVFGGDNDTLRPYTYDPTVVPPPPIPPALPALPTYNLDITNSTASTRLLEAPDGSKFAAGLSAQEIFDAGPTNSVFQSLIALQAALNTVPAANAPAAVSAVMDQLRAASDNLNTKLSFYGNLSNRIQDATNEANKQMVQLKTTLSDVQDADIPAAALEMQQATLTQQASLNAFANRPKNSLFDYLG